MDNETFTCICCGDVRPEYDIDEDIVQEDGKWVCRECSPEYIEEVSYNVEREERFYV